MRWGRSHCSVALGPPISSVLEIAVLSGRVFTLSSFEMELTTGKRVLAALFSAIVPGSGQLLKRERRKAALYLAIFALLLVFEWPIRAPETYVGLIAGKVGAICLALSRGFGCVAHRQRKESPLPHCPSHFSCPHSRRCAGQRHRPSGRISSLLLTNYFDGAVSLERGSGRG